MPGRPSCASASAYFGRPTLSSRIVASAPSRFTLRRLATIDTLATPKCVARCSLDFSTSARWSTHSFLPRSSILLQLRHSSSQSQLAMPPAARRTSKPEDAVPATVIAELDRLVNSRPVATPTPFAAVRRVKKSRANLLKLSDEVDSALFPRTSIRLPTPRMEETESNPNSAKSRKLKQETALYGSLNEQVAVIWACLNTDNVVRAEVLYRRLSKLFPDSVKTVLTDGMINAFIEGYLSPASLLKEKQQQAKTSLKRSTLLTLKRAGKHQSLSNLEKAWNWQRKFRTELNKKPGVVGYAALLRHVLSANDLDSAKRIVSEMDEELGLDKSWLEKLRSDSHFAELEDLSALDALLRSLGKLPATLSESETSPPWTSVVDKLMLTAMDEAATARESTVVEVTTEDTIASLRQNELVAMDSVGVRILRKTLDSMNLPEAARVLGEEDIQSLRLLRQLQLQQKLEEKALLAAEEEKEALNENLPQSMRDLVQMPSRYMVQWNRELVPLIKKELEAISEEAETEEKSKEHAIFLKLLTPEQLSRITITESLRIQGKERDNPESESGMVPVVKIMYNIGSAVEREYQLQKVMEFNKKKKKRVQSGVHNLHMNGNRLSDLKLRTMLGKIAREETKDDEDKNWQFKWPASVCVKAGSLLLTLLLKIARVKVPMPDPADPSKDIFREELAFQHIFIQSFEKKIGVIRLHPLLLEHLSTEPVHLHPRFLPMVVKPKPWITHNSGGYLNFKTPVIRIDANPEHVAYIEAADDRSHLVHIYEALDALGSTPWRINERVYEVMRQVWNSGKPLAGFPSADMPSPDPKPDNWADMSVKDRMQYLRMRNKVENERRNAFSQRCDLNYKMEIARTFRGFTMYFPHNMDFRGRAYPVPSLLNHVGNDICRGLLLFDNAKPLGEEGLRWLKVQVGSLAGYDKASFDERVKKCDEHLDDIIDSVEKPLTGRCWWLKAEDPWQLLATCYELVDALRSPNPSEFLSRIPIHQDGTCNGLQHYAALGGDKLGAQQVNLVASERPSDIYSAVAEKVQLAVETGAKDGDESCKKLVGRINRKLVKQTVMTNTYGVTFIGARRQVTSRMREQPELYPFTDDEINKLAPFVTKLIFDSLGELFGGARAIQNWLNTTARLIAKSSSIDSIPEVELDNAKALARLGCLPSPFTVAVAEIENTRKEEELLLSGESDLLLDAALGDSSENTSSSAKRRGDPGATSRASDALPLSSSLSVDEFSLDDLDAISDEAQEAFAVASKAAEQMRKTPDKMTSVIWTSPLGLPIVQPYRKFKVKTINTVLQTVNVLDTSCPLPVNPAKQSSAFPPNFIHSLDATHMMLSATACKREDMDFASVHDSYWTHACDVTAMSVILRESFIKLHSMNVMDRLRDELSDRYRGHKIPVEITVPETKVGGWRSHLESSGQMEPGSAKRVKRKMHTWVDLEIPPLPPKGDFDITEVMSSPYFFH
ncbi:hypothetical protein DFJ73DRAFT_135909 [Zopfochytrium polystomum]|nr:hypothetical protein DFJ73DRAFT_135909 [Zopfochytrium polystomum]